MSACLRTVNHLTPDTSGLVVPDNKTPNLLLSENPEHLSCELVQKVPIWAFTKMLLPFCSLVRIRLSREPELIGL